MILHIVRHGETVWHHENRYAGISDVKLTELGVEQATKLVTWATAAHLDAIVTSDLSRAIITAAPSAEACNLKPIVDPRFREVNFGSGEGMTKSEMQSEFPEEYSAFAGAPAEVALPNGERGVDAVTRAFEALKDIAECEELERVLVVAHSTLGRLLICALTGIPMNNYRKVFPGVKNGAVTTLEIPRVSSIAELYGSASLLEFNRPI